MTFIGKLLTFLTLIFGIGVAVFSTALYTQRPGWFAKAAEGGVDKGNTPLSFAQLGAEIDALSKTAVAANGAWGTELKVLQARERTRVDRHVKMFGVTPDGKRVTTANGTEAKGYLDYARTGTPPAAGAKERGPGFFEFEESPTTRLLDLDKPGAPIKGPDNLPLKGADTLLEAINRDAQAVSGTFDANGMLTGGLVQDLAKLRAEQKRLGEEVVLAETRLQKQRHIRDTLFEEAAYLAALEVNVAEQRETVVRRRDQLQRRLTQFRTK